MFYFVTEIFYFFICVKRVDNFSEHFYDDSCKILVGNSNIYIILVLASVG